MLFLIKKSSILWKEKYLKATVEWPGTLQWQIFCDKRQMIYG